VRGLRHCAKSVRYLSLVRRVCCSEQRIEHSRRASVCCSALQCVAVRCKVLHCAVSEFGAESVLQSLTACSICVGLSSSVEHCSTVIICIYVYMKIFV